MDTQKIINDLKAERDRIDEAIAALEALGLSKGTVAFRQQADASARPQIRRRGITSAGRKRLSELAKARWAARRKGVKAPEVVRQSRGRRTLSAAARKKIADAQRARWAARKKAAVNTPVKSSAKPKASAPKTEVKAE